jgi:hypothetical protein
MCQGAFRAPTLPNPTSGAAAKPAAPSGPEAETSAAPATKPPVDAVPKVKPEPTPAPERSTEYAGKFAIPLAPTALQWVPVGALFLILLLSAFTWVWFGYHDLTIASQNGWQAAFGLLSENNAYKAEPSNPFSEAENRPGFGFLAFLYLFLLIPSLAVAAAAAVIGLVPLQLPPAVQQALPWKWAIVAGLVFLGFLLLGLQLGAAGIGLENGVHGAVDRKYRADLAAARDDTNKAYAELVRARTLEGLHRTSFLTAVFWLQIIALVVAALLFVIDFRRTAPIPRVDVMW